jgi:hypothetical protein
VYKYEELKVMFVYMSLLVVHALIHRSSTNANWNPFQRNLKSLTSFADFLAFSYKIELNSSTALSDSSKTVFKKTSIFEGLSGLFKFPQNADNRKIFTHLDLNLEDYVNLKKNSIKVFEQLSNSQEKNPRVLGSSK